MTLRPLHQQYLVYKDPAGSDPDPAEYCPANGYVPDEPGTGSWELVAKFQTNSPNTTTFDPVLTTDPAVSTDKIAWRVGGVVYYAKDLSLTLDGTLQDAEIYVLKGSGLIITAITINSDHIVGTLDLSFLKSHPTLNTVITAHQNAQLTSIKFNQAEVFSISSISAYSCNLTGVIDLSFASKLANASIRFDSNANLERVIFPTVITTGTLSFLYLNNCNIKYPVDLRAFDISANAYIRVNSNANLNSILFPSAITGTINQIFLQYCKFTSLDLSVIASKLLTTGGIIQVNNNTTLTSLTLPLSATGKVSNFNCSYTALTSLDVSAYDFTDTAAFYANNCSSLTSITFKSGALGKFTQFSIAYSAITTIDISLLPYCILKASCAFSLNNNSMSAALVDKILFDFATIVATDATNYITRSIQIGGTGATANAAPTDGSVTGYDGIAAKAYLISRGVSVTTN
jgi:hypothetical protein